MEKSQIWVFMEQRGGVLHEVGLELLGKARELAEVSGSTVAAILLGAEVAPLADRIIHHGADLVLVAEHPALEPYRLLPYTDVLARACREHHPSVLLFGATSMGVELAPRLAAPPQDRPFGPLHRSAVGCQRQPPANGPRLGRRRRRHHPVSGTSPPDGHRDARSDAKV